MLSTESETETEAEKESHNQVLAKNERSYNNNGNIPVMGVTLVSRSVVVQKGCMYRYIS